MKSIYQIFMTVVLCFIVNTVTGQMSPMLVDPMPVDPMPIDTVPVDTLPNTTDTMDIACKANCGGGKCKFEVEVKSEKKSDCKDNEVTVTFHADSPPKKPGKNACEADYERADQG